MSTTTRQAATKPIKVGTWRRDFAGLQERRLEAARMFAHGATQAEVARTFGVSAQAAGVWYRRWRQGGAPALPGPGRAGRRRGGPGRSWTGSPRRWARDHQQWGATPSGGRWPGWQR
jgi:hypothetical protein